MGLPARLTRATALAALLLLALPVAAQEAGRDERSLLLPGIGASDPRRRVDQAAPPWRSLGRVQHEVGGRCTGALVGPRTVLTAAHCLVSHSGQMVQPRSVHFLLGYDRGQWTARARVTAFVTGPDYVPRSGPQGDDWALLTLDAPIGRPELVLPLLRQAPPPRTPAMIGGYQQDRPEVLLADTECRVIGLGTPAAGHPVLLHDCASTRGSSGAPVLLRLPDGRGWGIAGVVSGGARDVTLGIAAPAGRVGPLP
jgi:protease YdgD